MSLSSSEWVNLLGLVAVFCAVVWRGGVLGGAVRRLETDVGRLNTKLETVSETVAKIQGYLDREDQ